jgi:hypothetical protein
VNLKLHDVTCELSHELHRIGTTISEKSSHTARFRAGRIEGQPANTGNDNSNKIAVIKIAQQNKGNLCIDIPGCRIFRIVVMKFIAPSIELIPAK